MNFLVRYSVLLYFVAGPPARAYNYSLPPTTAIDLVVRDVDTNAELSEYRLKSDNQHVNIEKNLISLQDVREETGIPLHISADGYERRSIHIYLQNYNTGPKTSLAIYLSKPWPENTTVTQGDIRSAGHSDADRRVVALERLHGLVIEKSRNYLEVTHKLANAYYDNTFSNKQIAQCTKATDLYNVLLDRYSTGEKHSLKQLSIMKADLENHVNNCEKYPDELEKRHKEWKELANSQRKQN